MRPAVVLVLLCALGSLSTSSLGATQATTEGPRVTMFGDSIADALTYVPEARAVLGERIDLRLELSPCRKLVPVGCAYMGTRPRSVLDIVRTSSLTELGNIVIVAVGYNDPPNNYETDMAQVANALVDLGVGHIIWVTLREQTDGYREINDVILAQAHRWPELRVADWEAASRGKDWFNDDRLHLNAAGAVGLATLLRPYVLVACGAACAAAAPTAPSNVRRPTLRGTPVVGHVLTCRPGDWTGVRPIVLSYRWLRGTRVLAGNVSSSRRLGRADRGKLVACRVWAGNVGGAASATSVAVRIRAPS